MGDVDAGNDFHQRGLARAVLAHQGMHGARAQLEADVVECDHAREALADSVDLQQRRLGCVRGLR
jgi:hypothetical protein